jgi:hypothetical protein
MTIIIPNEKETRFENYEKKRLKGCHNEKDGKGE